jgi:hypothetical protein
MDVVRMVRASRLLALGLLLALLTGPRPALAGDIQDEIFQQAASLRGLTPKAEVPFAVVDSDQLRQDLLNSYNDNKTVQELEVSRKLLVLLGLLNPDLDLHDLLVNLYAENVLGYYNRDTRRMYVVSSGSMFGAEQKVTLAHEYTHALQDQYFDLHKVEAGTEDNDDYSLAVTSLIEGDAVLTQLLYARTYLTPQELFQLRSSGGTSSIDRAPSVVRDEVIFPYDEGVRFVARLWRQGGFQAVNDAFGDPPRSTAQIIHPEKYLAHQQPTEVALPDLAAALGPGWTQLRSDVLGELDVRILLEQFLDRAVADKGAEGWGGDRYALLENATGLDAVVISTIWDSDGEAGEFYNDYADTVGRRYGARARRVEDVPSRLVWATPNGSLLLQKWGPRLAIIMAPDAATMNLLVAAVGATAPSSLQRAPDRELEPLSTSIRASE